MAKRIPALDGLRGAAAVFVFLSHFPFVFTSFTSNPILLFLLYTISEGPNSVQILFVLSGFLMASLYPTVANTSGFIFKRYARVIPVYLIVVAFLAITTLFFKTNWMQSLAILFALSISSHLGWKTLRAKGCTERLAHIFFIIYCGLQVFALAIMLVVLPKVIHFHQLTLPLIQKNLITLFANATLTVPFAQAIPQLNGVFWSLAPEVLFYLAYPTIVAPLVRLCKQRGMLFSLVVIIGSIKILFDAQFAALHLAGLENLKITRATGFIAGVILGSLYEQRATSSLWRWLSSHLDNVFFGVSTLLGFILIQWMDWQLHWGQNISTMNWYYLVSSIVVALLVLSMLLHRTRIAQIFSHPTLVFLGTISYSLYLIHRPLLDIVAQALESASITPTQSMYAPLYIACALALVFPISWMLHVLIERFYFSPSTLKTKNKQSISSISPTFISLALIAIFFLIYLQGYTSAVLVSRIPIPRSATQLQTSNAVELPVFSPSPQLSVIAVPLEYIGDSDATAKQTSTPVAQLHFTLTDAQHHTLFSSQQHAYQIAGEYPYPFGFPTLEVSKQKQFFVQFETTQAQPNDKLTLTGIMPHTNMIAISTLNGTPLLQKVLQITFNRIKFVLTDERARFCFGFMIFLSISFAVEAEQRR